MATLPNPGFDDGSFDGGGFDTLAPTLDISTARDRRHQEWYRCQRCDVVYPREKMMNQNGLNVCFGADTNNCYDKPGHAALVPLLDVPYEERPEPLPFRDEEL